MEARIRSGSLLRKERSVTGLLSFRSQETRLPNNPKKVLSDFGS